MLGPPPASGLPPAIVVGAEVLGPGTGRSGSAGAHGADDLDALDAIPLPEPSAPLQLGGGLALLWLLGRRQARSPR